jgi:hypothetical protein
MKRGRSFKELQELDEEALEAREARKAFALSFVQRTKI